MKKVFLIGGGGFIGSHLARVLVAQGYAVVIYDAFISFIDPFTSHYQIMLDARFRGLRDKVVIERGDIRYQRHLSDVLMRHQPDIVVHLAATASAKESLLYPEESASINADGLMNVLESLRVLEHPERFVFTSSSFVYGNFQYEPADENHPVNPFDIYGVSKLSGEMATKTWCGRLGIPFTIIRPTAVYGFGDINKRISQIIIENAFNKKPVILHGGGESKIDFTYVDDTAMGFFLALSQKAGEGETFNIARGEGRKVKEFAAIVKGYFPDMVVEVQPADMTRPERGALGIKKARTMLGYEPRYAIEDGIRTYVEEYRAAFSKTS